MRGAGRNRSAIARDSPATGRGFAILEPQAPRSSKRLHPAQKIAPCKGSSETVSRLSRCRCPALARTPVGNALAFVPVALSMSEMRHAFLGRQPEDAHAPVRSRRIRGSACSGLDADAARNATARVPDCDHLMGGRPGNHHIGRSELHQCRIAHTARRAASVNRQGFRSKRSERGNWRWAESGANPSPADVPENRELYRQSRTFRRRRRPSETPNAPHFRHLAEPIFNAKPGSKFRANRHYSDQIAWTSAGPLHI